MENRFVLSKLNERQYIVTDAESFISIVFDKGKFNETQEVDIMPGSTDINPASLARSLREIGDWLVENHKDIIF